MLEHRVIMGHHPQVCLACTHNCRLFHPTTSTSPTSFFKVMVHQNDFTILYIPPMLNRTVSALVNKKINLEDSSGRRWVVTVSNVDGSFAFEEGWNVFSLDHGLKIGDLLVFNCINKLHFDVKIYDETACERLVFSKKRDLKKRSRDRSGGSTHRGGELVTQDPIALLVTNPDVPKMKSQHMEVDLGGTQNDIENISEHENEDGRVQSMCTSEHNEDTCYITTSIYQNDVVLCNEYPMFEEVLLGTGDTSYASELEMSGRNNFLSETDKIAHDKTSTLKLEENNEHNYKSIMSNREVQECQFGQGLGSDQAAISKEKHALHIDIGGFHNTTHEFNAISRLLDADVHIGEINEMPVDTSPKLYSFDDKLHVKGLPKVIEGEFNQDNERHFETADTLSCVVLTDNDCLKLPKCLPLSRRRKVQMERMVVLLRDPLRRLWPVLYHKKSWLNLLTDGWSDFQRANNIKPADVCVFQVENESERILAVHIVHKEQFVSNQDVDEDPCFMSFRHSQISL